MSSENENMHNNTEIQLLNTQKQEQKKRFRTLTKWYILRFFRTGGYPVVTNNTPTKIQ